MTEKHTGVFHQVLSEKQKDAGLGPILVQHFHSGDGEPRGGERQVDDVVQLPPQSRYGY